MIKIFKIIFIYICNNRYEPKNEILSNDPERMHEAAEEDKEPGEPGPLLFSE